MKTRVAIIGFGVAGANLAFSLRQKEIDFVVVNDDRPVSSSKVAAGLFNPITGKRAVKTWMADDLFPFADKFYSKVEETLKIKIRHQKNAFRLFKNTGDQNDIISKALEPHLKQYINTDFNSTQYKEYINGQAQGIEILKAGHVDLPNYLSNFIQLLKKEEKYIEKKIKNEDLLFQNNTLKLPQLNADYFVFCEGYQAINNPLFNWLPFSVTKGEMLKIRTPFPSSHILNNGFFFFFFEEKEEFWIGSSYERVADEHISEKGRAILTEKIGDFFKNGYQIIDQKGAVRPTVRDRRPFIGRHPQITNSYIFNGMGTKGVTLSPYFANQFINHLFGDVQLDKQVNIERYFSLYSQIK